MTAPPLPRRKPVRTFVDPALLMDLGLLRSFGRGQGGSAVAGPPTMPPSGFYPPLDARGESVPAPPMMPPPAVYRPPMRDPDGMTLPGTRATDAIARGRPSWTEIQNWRTFGGNDARNLEWTDPEERARRDAMRAANVVRAPMLATPPYGPTAAAPSGVTAPPYLAGGETTGPDFATAFAPAPEPGMEMLERAARHRLIADMNRRFPPFIPVEIIPAHLAPPPPMMPPPVDQPPAVATVPAAAPRRSFRDRAAEAQAEADRILAESRRRRAERQEQMERLREEREERERRLAEDRRWREDFERRRQRK